MGRPRKSFNLAQLEQELHALDAKRQGILSQIKSALEQLTQGFAAPMAGLNLDRPGKRAAKPRRRFSAASRKRLSQLAKERWAKAKKAGKSKLG